ncbi:MAG: hypothetical protein RIQ53_576 [Pseudomonadota bacterium]
MPTLAHPGPTRRHPVRTARPAMQPLRRTALAGLLLGVTPWLGACISDDDAPRQATLGRDSLPLISQDGYQFKDFNRNGRLEPFEDWRQSADARAADLTARMTLAEKAGTMMHGTLILDGSGAAIDLAATGALLTGNQVTTFITRMSADAATLATQHNRLQALAETTRLAVPVSISTDPRNHFQYTVGQSVSAGGFSQWPEALGLAAIDDAELTRNFGDIARQEYRAVGLHIALSPMADLATEPRWGRVFGTFGEDVDVVSRQVQAYVRGFQGRSDGLGAEGVVAVVKHWGGYGAAKDGWDSHNPYGKLMTFPGANLANHLRAFDGAFAAGVGSVMPTYSMPDGVVTVEGVTLENVGGGFNKPLLTDLLRTRRGYDGVILSDWGITSDCSGPCVDGAPAGVSPFAFWSSFGTSWGVETLSRRARFVKAVDAGMDQFGGTEESGFLVEAVQAGELTEARLDVSVRRILLQKFRQGLFENPYVDVQTASTVAAISAHHAQALEAQRRSIVLLQNRNQRLPLAASVRKVWLHGISADVARSYGYTVVATPAEADVALVRTATPYEVLHPGHVFGLLQHEGTLAFTDGQTDVEVIKAAAAVVPTIVTVYMDRPAVLTALVDRVDALLANFGVSDTALFDVVTGRASPRGKLPVELPRSMEAAAAQKSDLPHDSAQPLFPFGHGLGY